MYDEAHIDIGHVGTMGVGGYTTRYVKTAIGECAISVNGGSNRAERGCCDGF